MDQSRPELTCVGRPPSRSSDYRWAGLGYRRASLAYPKPFFIASKFDHLLLNFSILFGYLPPL